jgi:hypothetical protein
VHGRGEEAQLLGLEACPLSHASQSLAAGEPPVHEADEGYDSAVLVVRGVENERSGRGVRITGRGRDALDDRIENVGDALTCLRGDAQDAARILADEVGHLRGYGLGIGLREVDLVHDRDDLEVVLDREVRIRERLRLDALGCVDDEKCPLARLE